MDRDTMPAAPTVLGTDVKSCCAALYGNTWAHWLLGASFHPGGLALTQRLGAQLSLGPTTGLLDVASGRGTSALHLARTFGCSVVGIDLSQSNIDEARKAADEADLSSLVSFEVGDAEVLPFSAGSFDAVICECALCTFPDKATACAEIARVLKPGGVVGISDVTRQGDLPEALTGLIAAVACIADARPIDEYAALLEGAGLTIRLVERHDGVLNELLNQIRLRVLGAKVLSTTSDFDLSGFDIEAAQAMIRTAATAIQGGHLGYASVVAEKPHESRFAPSRDIVGN